LRRETKGRGGKTVVVISGFAALRGINEQTLHDIERQLKARLGCGGSVDSDKREVLIQGDRPEAVTELLRALGYEVAGVTTRPK
jgi:translation initiation factor 1